MKTTPEVPVPQSDNRNKEEKDTRSFQPLPAPPQARANVTIFGPRSSSVPLVVVLVKGSTLRPAFQTLVVVCLHRCCRCLSGTGQLAREAGGEDKSGDQRRC